MRRWRRLAGTFAIDLRSLAALRIGIALLLLWDLVRRSRDFSAHYTNQGVLPLPAYTGGGYGTPYDFSLHLLSGHAGWTLALFCVAAVAALALLCGLWTGPAAALSWVLLASLQNRVPFLEYGADALLRLLLFWGLWLPLGAQWSVDAWRRGTRSDATTVCSWTSAALIMQVVLLYWCSVLIKNTPPWRSEGSASLYILAANQFTTSLGIHVYHLLKAHPAVAHLFTYLSVVTEAVAPLFLLSPWCPKWTRLIGVALLAGLHIGIGLCLDLGLFPWVDLVALLPFIPGAVWSRQVKVVPPVFCQAPSPFVDHAKQLLAGVCLVAVVLWNLTTVPQVALTPPKPLFAFVRALRLDQNWQLFAPRPIAFGGWVVSVGYLSDGSTVDLFKTGSTHLTWDRPADIAASYRNDRWRLILVEMLSAQHRHYGHLFADYLCRNWAAQHQGPPFLSQVELVDMHELTMVSLDGYYLRPESILHYDCPQPVGSTVGPKS